MVRNKRKKEQRKERRVSGLIKKRKNWLRQMLQLDLGMICQMIQAYATEERGFRHAVTVFNTLQEKRKR